jgi:hypothetical protein
MFWRISIPLSFSCSGEVDESLFYISPYDFNANSIFDIKTFKPSHQLSFHRRVKEANPGSFFSGAPILSQASPPLFGLFWVTRFHLLSL